MRWLPAGAVLLALLRPALADTAAVLPFSHTGAAADNLDWIGESIAETVREALGSRGFLTLSRDDIQEAYHRLALRERARMSEASIIKIGEALDAEEVVFGDFRFTPAPAGAALSATPSTPASRGSLRISARIIDRKHVKLGPEFAETGALEDLATLEAHLAWQALTLLAPKLAPPESDFRTLRPPIRLSAEEYYVRGLLARNVDQKEKFFLQAVRLDSHFAHPCLELGRINYDREDYRQAADWLEKVGSDDMHYRQASFLLGLALYHSNDFAGAEKAFEMIARSVPLPEVYNNLGAAESRLNQSTAIDSFRKALDGDSNDSDYSFNLAYAFWKKGEFTAAAERFRAVLNRKPNDDMAAMLLDRCQRRVAITSDLKTQGLERLKTNYEERAYWQLKAALGQETR